MVVMKMSWKAIWHFIGEVISLSEVRIHKKSVKKSKQTPQIKKKKLKSQLSDFVLPQEDDIRGKKVALSLC